LDVERAVSYVFVYVTKMSEARKKEKWLSLG